MTAIIFGINGQDGYYLSELLKRNNMEVVGVSRSKGNWLTGDVSDLSFVSKLIKDIKPDYIFHFAANSSTNHDFLFENHETITKGTLSILESVKNFAPSCRVFISGSGLQFKNNGMPIDENFPFEARDAYSVARIHSVYAARYYRQFGLKIFIGYFFNHDSPLRNIRHINQKIIDTAFRISKGENIKLQIGDVEVEKEFGFSGDIVSAVWKLVNNDRIVEAVIGTGKSYSIKNWLDICFAHYKLNWADHVTANPDFKPEYRILVSNPARLSELGWKPETSFENLAEMMIKFNEKR